MTKNEMITKICTKCKEEKETSEFSKSKQYKDGFHPHCKLCCKNKQNNYYNKNNEKLLIQRKEYYNNNKDIIKNKVKEYSSNNKDKIKEYKKEYAQKNKEQILNKSKEKYVKNREKILKQQKEYRLNNKDKVKEYNKKHKEETFARDSIKRILKDWKGSRQKYELVLGYTFNDLRIHLSRFGDIKELTVDHIIPINYLSTLIKDEKELAKWANRLENLMLLSKSENSSKHAKLTIEYIPDHHMFDFMCYCIELEEFISNHPHQDQHQ